MLKIAKTMPHGPWEKQKFTILVSGHSLSQVDFN